MLSGAMRLRRSLLRAAVKNGRSLGGLHVFRAPDGVRGPSAYDVHVGPSLVGGVSFQEFRVFLGVEQAPRDGANAEVEPGKLAPSGFLELLGRGERCRHLSHYGERDPDADGSKDAFSPDLGYRCPPRTPGPPKTIPCPQCRFAGLAFV